MRPNVGCQVIRPAKVTLARLALERLDSCVLPDVPGELVGTGEPLVATVVRARKRFLACVGAQVRL